MPYRIELLWQLVNRLLDSTAKSRSAGLDETIQLVERELSFIEKGLVDHRDPNSQAFLKALLSELNPAVATSWEELSTGQRERLQNIRLRVLRLGMQRRQGVRALQTQCVDELGMVFTETCDGH